MVRALEGSVLLRRDADESAQWPAVTRAAARLKMRVALGSAFAAVALAGARLEWSRARASEAARDALSEADASSSSSAAAASSSTTSASASSSDATATRPHILFIVPDDMGWNDVGYQSTDLSFATPTIDRLAATGLKIGTYYTESSCTPARSALMSGSYSTSVGMGMDWQGAFTIDSPYGLDRARAPTLLPEVLRRAGYATHMVGKWNIGHYAEGLLPHRRGFDSHSSHLGEPRRPCAAVTPSL